jgi:chromatin remodeling complex protein RSC6
MTEPKQRKSKRSSKVSRQSSKKVRDEYVPDVADVLTEPSNTAAQSVPVKQSKVKKSNKLSKKSSDGKKVKSKKSKSRPVVEASTETPVEVEAPVEVATTSEVATETVPEAVDFTRLTSRRGLVSREELEGHFDQYLTFLERELDSSRTDKNRKVSVKTFRTLIKEAKVLKSNSLRVMKKPKKRSSNTQSGFMKPVAITSDMASFAGWDPSELKSRVDVARYICDYIKENNLQNPEDRRQILADKKLTKLLDYNADKEDKLTYYYLQKKIQPLFKK